MTLFKKNHFSKQAIIILSAQTPKDPSQLIEYQEHIKSLIKTFDKYTLGQKIIVLGDQQLIEEALLKSSEWLFAYNSAYEQPLMTSLQRGISLTHDTIESAMIWPVNIDSAPLNETFQMLQDQRNNLNKVIMLKQQPYPVCIPRNKFKHLLSLHGSKMLHEEINCNLLFTKR